MLLRATLLTALVAVAGLAQASAQTSSVTITTPTVSTTVFDNGNIGGDCSGSPAAFQYTGDEGLCGAGVLFARGPGDVIGDGYILNASTGWTPFGIGTPTSFPYAGFDQGHRLIYDNVVGMDDITVFQTVYYGTTYPDVVLHEVSVFVSYDLPGAYIGVFADWDVGGTVFDSNVATRDGSTIYVTDPTATSTNVFGTSILGRDLSGWDFNIAYPPAAGQPQDEAEMYVGMTTPSPDSNPYPGPDTRYVKGTGPFDLSAGETVTVLIAFAAGDSVDDFLQNIADVAAVVVADESGPQGSGVSLSAPSPNPAAGAAGVTLSLDAAQAVRVTVTDVLGRTVATLHDGALAAGETRLAVDTGALTPGVYMIRADGETVRATRTLTVAR